MDLYDYWFFNVPVYALQQRGRKLWRRAHHTWTARRRQVQARLTAWREARTRQKEVRRMPTEVEKQAMFKAMLPELDQDFLALVLLC